MTTEKINVLDEILQRNHQEVYASLHHAEENCSSLDPPLRDWYQWKNGQTRETENWFLDLYRFVSLEQARQVSNFASDYSLPLLSDDAGEGYYFDMISHRVFYNAATFYNKEDRFFASFESFVDFLIELAEIPPRSIGESLDREEVLLGKYTR